MSSGHPESLSFGESCLVLFESGMEDQHMELRRVGPNRTALLVSRRTLTSFTCPPLALPYIYILCSTDSQTSQSPPQTSNSRIVQLSYRDGQPLRHPQSLHIASGLRSKHNKRKLSILCSCIWQPLWLPSLAQHKQSDPARAMV